MTARSPETLTSNEWSLSTMSIPTNLIANPAITRVRFISKQDALKDFRCIFRKDDPSLVHGTSAADLPASFRVRLAPGAAAADVRLQLQTINGVRTVADETKIGQNTTIH